MPELVETTRYKVRYVPAPAWEVGEGTPDVIPGSHYPDDYAGKVLAVLPADDESDAGGAVDATLELTDEQARRLACREFKVGAGGPLVTTFDDRWGAAADLIRAEFVDAEQAEANAQAEQDAPQLSQPATLMSVLTRGFDEVAALAKSSLPKNAAHTGTGYYATKKVPTKNDDTQSGPPVGQVITLVTGGLGTADAFKGGYVNNMTDIETRAIVSHTDDTITLEGNLINWTDTDDLDIYDAETTVQGSLNQLWIDQGVAVFTASQYVRIYAGTYAENVVPNAGLASGLQDGYWLVLEGDPSDSRGNIVIDPAAGWAIQTNTDQMLVRHLKAAGATSIRFDGANFRSVIRDCILHPATSFGVQRIQHGPFAIEDSEITCQAAGQTAIRFGSGDQERVVKRCKISAKYGMTYGYAGTAHVEACVFDIESGGVAAFCIVATERFHYGLMYRMVNCTVFGGTYGFHVGAADYAVITDCIFKDVTYPIRLRVPPENTATRNGTIVELRNNCLHGHTGAAYVAGVAKTLAELEAYDLVDSAGNIESDPQLTNPGADDFSLEPTSPCRHAGHGSGVVYDYTSFDGSDVSAFHPNTPDIGAWSGESSVSAVTWPSSLPQTVDQSTFGENLADVVERSQMDTGPAKVRRRFTSGVQTFQASVTLTIAQAVTLQTFFDTTTMGGSLEFEWAHPRTAATARMRFITPPQLMQPGPQHFVASLALEILP